MRSGEKDNKRSIGLVNDRFKKWQDKSKKKSQAAHNIRMQQRERLTEATKEEMKARKERSMDDEDLEELLRQEKEKDREKEKEKKKGYHTLSNSSPHSSSKDVRDVQK